MSCEATPCTSDCQYGYVVDENGCELCECAPAPSCEGLDAATCQKTVGCQAFCALDAGGAGAFTGCFSSDSPPPPNQAPCAPGSHASVVAECPATESDAFNLMDARIEGDVLYLGVGYGGGCEEHVFTFCWDGAFAESFPVQSRLGIHHEGNDDACDAYLSEEITVDLTPFKTAYQTGYQTKAGQIIIHLGETGKSVVYDF